MPRPLPCRFAMEARDEVNWSENCATISEPNRDWRPEPALTTNPAIKEQGVMAESQSSEHVEYRPIDGFPAYRVGSDGTIWSALVIGGRRKSGSLSTEWKKLSQKTGSRGRRSVVLFKNEVRKDFLVHKIVLEAFVGKNPPGTECCHNDGNSGNNRLDNLRWGTHLENMEDQRRHGTRAWGQKHPRAKLNDQQVAEIIGSNSRTKDLSKQFGVTPTQISHIRHRKHWRHLNAGVKNG